MVANLQMVAGDMGLQLIIINRDQFTCRKWRLWMIQLKSLPSPNTALLILHPPQAPPPSLSQHGGISNNLKRLRLEPESAAWKSCFIIESPLNRQIFKSVLLSEQHKWNFANLYNNTQLNLSTHPQDFMHE